MSIYAAIENFDIISYLGDYPVVDQGNEEWVLDCPRCGKPKLTVNIEKRTWHCWVCEAYSVLGNTGSGGLLSLIQWLESVSKFQAVQKVLNQYRVTPEGLQYIDAELQQKMSDLVTIPEPFPLPAPEFWLPVTSNLTYLQKRGITIEDARAFGLGWCAYGRYANRLIFPVWEGGALVYYQGRAMWELGPGEVKALNPPHTEGAAVSSEVLMNLDVARHYPRVAVTEGPVDCIKAGPSAVCTFGKKISAVQIAKLKRAGVQNLDLMWDADAIPEMEKAAPLLSVLFDDVRIVRLPEGTDPGDHTRATLDWHRANATKPQGLLEV